MQKSSIAPLILVMDPLLKDHSMSVKVYSFLRNTYASKTQACFSEIKFNFMTENTAATGLDILLHGQDYSDTLALLLSEDSLDTDYDNK